TASDTNLLYGSVLTSLGSVHRLQGLPVDSLFSTALRVFTVHAWADQLSEQPFRIDYGICLIGVGEHVAGIKMIVDALAAVCVTPTAYLHLGRGCLEIGDLSAGESSLRKAAAISPSPPEVQLELGRLCPKQARWTEASPAYASAALSYVASSR